MTKREKRLKKIRNNPKNVRFKELEALLVDFDFEYERASGSHRLFTREIGGESVSISVPYKKVVKETYVKDVLKLIDQIVEDEEDGD
jgi:predicted RNA binding protein YcfA (HicA-like mRNA interferase family)